MEDVSQSRRLGEEQRILENAFSKRRSNTKPSGVMSLSWKSVACTHLVPLYSPEDPGGEEINYSIPSIKSVYFNPKKSPG
ncbi:hypothetical protein CEXT_596851 [Caerostris extrusa]|uniref:Uncharacterized protein n=1 Tax=Caerostris extrusa TaxID=172846 RepID=A0AAV4TB08_CAEEX|nr:hypothetical protein CEXT_596851 [Caerostris extrusa]